MTDGPPPPAPFPGEAEQLAAVGELALGAAQPFTGPYACTTAAEWYLLYLATVPDRYDMLTMAGITYWPRLGWVAPRDPNSYWYPRQYWEFRWAAFRGPTTLSYGLIIWVPPDVSGQVTPVNPAAVVALRATAGGGG
jgi:hypothetical protein